MKDGPDMYSYIVAACIGYALGCLNLAYFISRKHHLDMKSQGSGNLGASNAAITLGVKYGAMVAAHDILKAIIAITLASRLFPDSAYAKYIAGAFAVLGHIFPFYLKFSGGKGFAPFIGFAVAANWRFAVILALTAFLLVLITDYIVAATYTSIVTFPLYEAVYKANMIGAIIIGIISLIIFMKHIENIERIKNHTESSVRETIFRKRKR